MENAYLTPLRPPFDSAVSDAITAAADDWGGGAKRMDVGIADERGQIYRRVRAWGMGEYTRLVNQLKERGFANEGAGRGYDDVFRFVGGAA
ncbi:hypothetical protein N8I74_06720 [Chitiniphilus purpureus]|uniref:Uncharacterized protein n=1 Tax=Chitiniphilus purpureus TaxID=2981137 RepID=A0ABY6DQR1_9NEIS|nr:hypothetical protein [Chitiniphilus sp. CD1]UXY16709.1 hypothetical protein N8I74_06720 [Chitiniphilus sp. CD1]